ncbi:MAG: hypothetical protein NZ929_03215, partial [Aigarchaeota archaeon]|nr:hypothetical protein [Aigarchaeota archaeon]
LFYNLWRLKDSESIMKILLSNTVIYEGNIFTISLQDLKYMVVRDGECIPNCYSFFYSFEVFSKSVKYLHHSPRTD